MSNVVTYRCGHCRCKQRLHVQWQSIADGRRQIRGKCDVCGSITYLAQTEGNIAAADAAPPAAKQMEMF